MDKNQIRQFIVYLEEIRNDLSGWADYQSREEIVAAIERRLVRINHQIANYRETLRA